MFGSLKEGFSWLMNGGDIQKEAVGFCFVAYLGGDLIHIRSCLGGELKTESKEFSAWATKWFDFIDDWHKVIIHNKWVIWTTWSGVPLVAWCPRFFKKVTAKFGSLICMDEDTKLKNNLNKARILIKTSLPKLSESPLEVMVDGKGYQIKIVEEGECISLGRSKSMALEENSAVSGHRDSSPARTVIEESPNLNFLVNSMGKVGAGVSNTHNHEIPHALRNSQNSPRILAAGESNESLGISKVGPSPGAIKILKRGIDPVTAATCHSCIAVDPPQAISGPHDLNSSASIDLNKPASSSPISLSNRFNILAQHKKSKSGAQSYSSSSVPNSREPSFLPAENPQIDKQSSRKGKMKSNELVDVEIANNSFQEATETWRLGKRLGLNSVESDESVSERIEHLIAQDTRSKKKNKAKVYKEKRRSNSKPQ